MVWEGVCGQAVTHKQFLSSPAFTTLVLVSPIKQGPKHAVLTRRHHAALRTKNFPLLLVLEITWKVSYHQKRVFSTAAAAYCSLRFAFVDALFHVAVECCFFLQPQGSRPMAAKRGSLLCEYLRHIISIQQLYIAPVFHVQTDFEKIGVRLVSVRWLSHIVCCTQKPGHLRREWGYS